MRIGTSMSTKRLDQACVDEYKIPLIVMMENAVMSALKHLDINLYDMFQKKLSSRIEKYKLEILELEKKCSSLEPLDVRIENAKKSIRKLLDINYNGVDEKVIEEFVEKVIVHKDYFEWKLNFMNETIKLEVDGKSRKDGFLIERTSNSQ